MDCPFCQSPDIAGRTIAETPLVFAFLTNTPIVPGHTLVCPRRCVARFDELQADERAALFEMITCIKSMLVKAFRAEGFNIAWNEGKIAGQSVPHLHIHILPRRAGDTGITEYEPRRFLYRPDSPRAISPEQELKKVAQLIREAK